MQNKTWQIWNKDDSVEQRTYKRVTGELQEMESTKQLVELISTIYTNGMKILDVGCAAGHYYHGLRRIDNNIQYYGVDATIQYISFAQNYFKNNPNTHFEVGDIYNLSDRYTSNFDIVFCCNVLLHLPSFKTPLENLLKSSKKYCIIRTLISENTHLSKFLYSDEFDDNGEPIDFVFQNTYSFKIVENFIKSIGDYKIEFIDDKFDPLKINEEFRDYNKTQSAVTYIQNNLQIAGSKVFQWKWIKITKS